jgi:ribose/xylose/arabinose/galactoside ABC-type transport system permease subunit
VVEVDSGGGRPESRIAELRRLDGLGHRVRALSTELQLLLGLVALYAAFAIPYSSKFSTVDNTSNMAQQGAILLIVALGQMFALLIGGFDISVGANMGFVSVVAARGMTEHGLVPGILMGLATGLAVGLVNGILIAGLRISPFAATLGMLAFLIGLGNVLGHGASVGGLPADFQYLGSADWGSFPSAVGIAAIALVLVWLVLRRFRMGLYIYGIGGSRDTARLAGVPAVRYEILAYTACGFLAGVAGLMVASRVSIGQAEIGSGYELLSIATAVIGGVAIGGGVGRLSGVILAASLITVLNTGMDIAGVQEYSHRMVTGAVIVVAALVGQLRAGSLREFAQRVAGILWRRPLTARGARAEG